MNNEQQSHFAGSSPAKRTILPRKTTGFRVIMRRRTRRKDWVDSPATKQRSQKEVGKSQ